MKIAIVGAGIVGVTTAYELAHDGHDVTVFDQRNAAAEEASFAPAGLMAPCALSPWALPGFGHALRLLGPQATLRWSGGLTASNWAWFRRWRATSRNGSAPAAALERMARYSQARTAAIAQRHELDFEAHSGRLVLLRTEPERVQLQPALALLRDCGVTLHEIDAASARKIEPGLSPDAQLAAAIHLPNASTGNCRLYAQLLRQGTQGTAVHFAFSTRVERIHTSPVSLALQGEKNPRQFDAVVLCAGAASAALLAPLGLRLPMAALYGYSVSAPLRESTHAPRGSVVDLAQNMSITRLGQRVRIAGGAELAGAGAAHHAPTLQRLYRTLNDWFPGGAQLSTGLQIWRGARAVLPDGAPVLGASGLAGIWLNTGHGAGGWALAGGCARAIADLIAQREPEVALTGLGMRQF